MLYSETEGEGHPIVFIHGALVSSTMWSAQVERLKDEYLVITIDLPEHGKSRNKVLKDYTVQSLCSSVMGLLSELDITRFNLCGHSLGGMVAQEIAMTNPECVRSLILAETSYGTRNTLGERVSSWASEKMLYLMTQKQLVNMSARTYGKLNTDTRKYIEEEISVYSITQSRRVMAAALNYSSKERLANININTLILVGAENRQTHGQAHAMNQLIKNSELVSVPAAHHLLNMDNAAFFNDQVYKHLAG